MNVAVTGHRPTGLWGYRPHPGYRMLRDTLARTFTKLINERGVDTFLSGMAPGADTLAFDACLKLREEHGIQLVAVVPYEEQDKKWEPEQRDRYRARLRMADQIIHVDTLPDCQVAAVPIGAYQAGKLLARNQHLVDHASVVVAVWSGEQRGGTFDTVTRCKEAGKELIIINPFQFYGR